MRKLSIKGKIMFLTFFIIAFSFVVAGIAVIGAILNEKEEEMGSRAMLIARTVSNLPEITEQLENHDINKSSEIIHNTIENIRVINKAEYIVIMNMNRVKLSHPSKKQIGEVSLSSDINAAFAEHYYVSKAKGEKGVMIRAFAPIINNNKKQIGVIVVGYSLPTLFQILVEYQSEIFLTIIISLFISSWGALALGKHVKKQMFGLEPHEIAKMYVERTETFNVMHEGIIAVDKDLNITIFNVKASEILGVDPRLESLIGKKIYDVLGDTRLPEIVESGKSIYNQEVYVNGHSILSTRIPIKVKSKIVGAVAIFNDRTEAKKLAEELTGVKAFVQALRVQTHEHKNKMHTIAGLLQLGHVKQALEYLTSVKEEHDTITKFLNKKIHNENVSGLLLSKISHGRELGIHVEIDKESKLTKFPDKLDHHDFVILLGNLIENAFDALKQANVKEKQVYISIDDSDGVLAILISDNGVGMSKEVQGRMFENGFSTKGSVNRGIGLYLIHEIVEKGNGLIEVTSELNKGTTIVITFEL